MMKIKELLSKFKEFFKKRDVASYINIAVFLLTLVSLIVYLVYATSAEGLITPWVIVLLCAVLVGEGVLFFFDNDYIPIIVPFLLILAFGCFLYTPQTTLFTIVYTMQGIVMDGTNPDNLGIIIAILVLILITGISAIASCFLDRLKNNDYNFSV